MTIDALETDLIVLDTDFATTRWVTTNQPEINSDRPSKFLSFLNSPANPERKGEGGLRTKGYFKRTQENLPLITIITIVFNGEKLLEKTIESVINQDYNNVEYIVIDGASTDRSLDVIRRYQDQIDYWVSEPDQGIGDAMNKGIQLATGSLINHLHAGDQLSSPDILSRIVESYLNEQWRWCYGNQNLRDSEDKLVGCFTPAKFSKTLLHLLNIIPHQTLFCERSLLQEVGLFDNRYQCAMDYHLWLRFTQLCQPKQFDFAIADFLLGGRSGDMKLAMKEEFLARKEVLKQSPLEQLISLTVVTLRYIKRKLKITTFVNQNIS